MTHLTSPWARSVRLSSGQAAVWISPAVYVPPHVSCLPGLTSGLLSGPSTSTLLEGGLPERRIRVVAVSP